MLFRHHLALAAALVAPLFACAPPRTTPATWTAATTFDVKSSDPRALKIADEVNAATGGEAAWSKVKELEWSQALEVDGQLARDAEHAWDRWNGRHRFKSTKGGFLVMHDLFDNTGKGWALKDDRPTEATRAQMRDMMDRARQQWAEDSYILCLPFKLKDPGAHVRWMEERTDAKDPNLKLDVIRVSFDRGVGRDVYYVVVDRNTHMPDSIEWVKEGKSDHERIGYKLSDWIEVGGLKFASKRQNVGYAGEVVKVSGIKTSDSPHDEYYVPQVR